MTSENNWGQGMKSLSCLVDLKRTLCGPALALDVEGCSPTAPRLVVKQALCRRDLNRAGWKSPVKAGVAGAKPSSSENSRASGPSSPRSESDEESSVSGGRTRLTGR